ncbi:hypothetical protein acsn021_13990 [Anaerocolumna cellulosilytica]|uniref:Uncharacterized protein n=1 Tax=Anaerocolumna cellulosilytica TaxID=433286 RepID=A0A6S6R3A4_9FIRM|nr:hypothetical protein [Anaerocolumna cellulosilytica]MBB5195587.1 hypothetical protein [Anaerocolumna cellulosilytica]BCJ93830.1 hypothetical protein acsn021_13990 [Anaerocolumna cellulosilytica]
MNRRNCINTTTSIRKLTYIFIIISLLALTGCTSKEERQKAKDNEVLAKPIVQEYLELNYGGGKVDYLDCLKTPITDNGPIPLFYKNASPFVKASVRVNDKEFLVIANVETGKCYDNYNESLVLEDLKSYVVSSLSIDAPYEMEVHYYPKELIGEVDNSKYENFAEYGISSTDGLFKNDHYRIYVVCKYIDSDMEFGSVDTKHFFPETEVSEVYLALINFRNKDRYIKGDMVSVSNFRFNDYQHYYSLSDVVTAKKEKVLDYESQNYVYDDNVDYNYARYRLESMNGIEFVWNDSLFSVDLEVVPAEKEIQTKFYEYYTTNDEAVYLESTPRLENTDYIRKDIDNKIYCYFDKAMYDQEILITYNNDSYNKEDDWTVKETLSLKTDGYIYEHLYISDNKKTTMTLGFYKEK